jgi:hypothetical protein
MKFNALVKDYEALNNDRKITSILTFLLDADYLVYSEALTLLDFLKSIDNKGEEVKQLADMILYKYLSNQPKFEKIVERWFSF